MIFDPLYLVFIIPGLLLGIYAQMRLSSAYGRYSRVGTQSGISGARAARELLDRDGLVDVPVHEVGGRLTDHYDPTKRALFLSSGNFHGRSIAAVGVAAHEAGHALQHAAAYAPLKLRMALVPATQFASNAWQGILVLGTILWVMGLAGAALYSKFILMAVVIFSIITFFQAVTLPVEFDASKRAKEQLQKFGIVSAAEAPHISKVLTAAALTYVAAMISSVMQLLYFLMLARGRD